MRHLFDVFNEAQWKSCNGGFNAEDVKQLEKESKLSIKTIYKALDIYDENIGGHAEWEIGSDGKTLIFKNPTTGKSYKYDIDDDEWNEIK